MLTWTGRWPDHVQSLTQGKNLTRSVPKIGCVDAMGEFARLEQFTILNKTLLSASSFSTGMSLETFRRTLKFTCIIQNGLNSVTESVSLECKSKHPNLLTGKETDSNLEDWAIVRIKNQRQCGINTKRKIMRCLG